MLQSMGSQRVGLDLASEQQDPYHEVFPRGRNLSPKRNQLVTLKSQETKESSRKRGNYLPGRSHSAVDLKRLPLARAEL